MSDIKMPQLSDSMEDGIIGRWLVSDGQMITVGEDLVEIESDKAVVMHPSETNGIIEILVAEGESVPVGTVIARTGVAQSEGVQVGHEAGHEHVEILTDSSLPHAHENEQGATVSIMPPAGDNEPAGVAACPVEGVPRRRLATPLAARVAEEYGVAIDKVKGTGPHQRITRSDVLRAAGMESRQTPRDRQFSSHAEPSEIEATLDSGRGDSVRWQMNRVQATIARRLTETKRTVPEFQVQTEVRMDEALALRAQIKGHESNTSIPSINDLIIKACALALRDHPNVNASCRGDDTVEMFRRINIGFAVAAPENLVVATIRDADTKSLGQISVESRRLSERVRQGTIGLDEMTDSTFSISNLGMYGITSMTPIINGAQAAILGVGAVRSVLVKSGNELVEQRHMTLTASCDHRVLYGADAAVFLRQIKGLLESPILLAL